jgi:hypothetical protein
VTQVVELQRFQTCGQVDPPDWDRHVAALGGSVFHTHAWAMFLRHGLGGQPVFARWMDAAGEVAAVAVGSFRSPIQGKLGRVALTLSFDAPPTVAKSASMPSLESVVAWARRQGAVVLALNSFDSGGRSWRGDLHDCNERIEFLARPGDERELRRRMRRQGAALNRAERLGLEIDRGDEAQAFRFAELFASTVARLKEDKGVALGSVNTHRFAAGLSALLASKRARLYLARLDGEYVAGCVFGVAGENAYYLYNGSTETALRVGATPMTLLRAMTDLSEDGFERINLGGVPSSAREPGAPDHGLYSFKLGLGGEPVICRGGRVRLRPIRLTFLEIARSISAGRIRRERGMDR